MANIFTTLIGAINKNRALILDHVGRNQEAHEIATFGTAGFLSPEDKSMFSGRARFLTEKTDIFQLPEGIYSSSGNFINAPEEVDNSFAIVEIIGSGTTDQKIIKYHWINARKIYTAYKSYSDPKPIWYNPFYSKVDMRGNNTASHNELFVEKTDHANIVFLELDGNLTLNAGAYQTVGNLGPGRLFPKTDRAFSIAAINKASGFITVTMQITRSGNINIINTSSSEMRSYSATVSFVLVNPRQRAVESMNG